MINDPIKVSQLENQDETKKIKDLVADIIKQPIHSNPPKYL